MNKEEYLIKLREALTKIAISNVESRIEYYSEMIDDRIEDGMSEEEAVNSMESIESIVETSKLEKPMPVLVKEKVQKSKEAAEKKGHGALWVVLAIIGFPIWLPLLLVAGVLFLVMYILLWVLVLVCYSVEMAFALAALASLVLPFISLGNQAFASILMCIGGIFLFTGLTIILWKPINTLSKVTIRVFTGFIRSFKKKVLK